MPVPQKLPQIPVLPAGYPHLRKPILPQQLENMLSILAVRLMLAHSLGSDLGRIPNPQLDVQFCQQSLEPACVSTGFHPQTNGFSLAGKLAVELLASSRCSSRCSFTSPVSVSTYAICWKPGW